jgi:LysM repeat protein
MSEKVTWTTLIETVSERSYRMRAPALVVIVILVHALAVGAVMFIQGCGTTTPRQPETLSAEPPPAPVMPPKGTETPSTMVAPRPVFQPPSPVESAPSMSIPGGTQSYKIQNGDSLSKIAKHFGVSARELAEINGIKDPNKIRIGQTIVLPEYAGGSGAAAKPKTSKPAAKGKASSSVAPSVEGLVYVVQAGDSLSKIASKHGVKVGALREANQLKSDKILAGQKLVVPTAAPPAAEAQVPAEIAPAPMAEPAPAQASIPPPVEPRNMAPAPAPAPQAMEAAPADPKPVAQDQALDYTVQDGDTLDSIAKLFIVRREDIMRLNGLADPSSVRPGMKLKIPPTSL